MALSSSSRAGLGRTTTTLLFIGACVMMLTNYYSYDSIAPIASLLQKQLHFSDVQLGTLNAVYSLPNIVMVFIAGLLCDRFGVVTMLVVTSVICAVGAFLVALTPYFSVMVVGRLLFGIGAESMCVASLVALALWLGSGWLALGMAVNVGMSRFGSYLADLSPTIFKSAYATGWQEPQWISFGMAVLCVVAALFCYAIAPKKDAVKSAGHAEKAAHQPFSFKGMLALDRSFWYLVILCVAFYSAIIVFRSTFSILYFENAHHLSLAAAGQLNSYVFLAAIIFTPIFGFINDRFGRHGLMLSVGGLCSVVAFALLAFGSNDLVTVTVLLGLCYSLVPAVIWPAASFVAPAAQLGLVYGIMNAVQNLFLTLVNFGAGWLNDSNQASAAHPAGYNPMIWLFFALCTIGFIAAVLFWIRGLRVHKPIETIAVKS